VANGRTRSPAARLLEWILGAVPVRSAWDSIAQSGEQDLREAMRACHGAGVVSAAGGGGTEPGTQFRRWTPDTVLVPARTDAATRVRSAGS
jgi:hypothetical protein